MLAWIASLASLGFMATNSPALAAELTVDAAYESPGGTLVVELAGNSAGNTIFWGSRTRLYQLELTWSGLTKSGKQFTFYRREQDPSPPEINLESESARVKCDESEVAFGRLGPAPTQMLATAIRDGRTPLRFLPEIQEPLYLFKLRDRDEYVYVSTPRFNFHGDYAVFLGPLGHWKRVEVTPSIPDPQAGQADLIRFRSGGGLYVPRTIDLFSHDTEATNRGSPFLIRSQGGSIETLEKAPIDPRKLGSLGILARATPKLETPCTN